MRDTGTRTYPVFLNLIGVRCVVVGGGKVAERKVRGLLETGAEIYVISPTLTVQLEIWKQQSRFIHIKRKYSPQDLHGARFVFAATNQSDVNTQVHHDSIAIGAQVNVADQPQLCTFTVPSTLRRGDFTLAVSTGGANPAMAKAIRSYLENIFGEEWQDIMQFMGKYRQYINDRIQDDRKRSAFYQSLLSSNEWFAVITTNQEEAKAILDKMLERLEEH
jgi:precorrin-2 dehydrogenase / sirohydrochlorin ferrochelatase